MASFNASMQKSASNELEIRQASGFGNIKLTP
jgi:hypothetical protein